MRTSEAGLTLIKSFEGCMEPIGGGKFKPYYCPAGVLTIGWGHTNDGGRPFTEASVWTQADCDQALRDDLVRYEQMVARRVKVPLTQGQFDALVSFTYNCGEGNLARSTLLRCVNAKDWDGAAKAFGAWVKGGGKVLNGLVRRRAAEAAMFRRASSVAPAPVPAPAPAPTVPDEPMPQRVDLPDTGGVEPTAGGFFSRLRNWITGLVSTGGLAGLGALTEWKIALIVFGSLFLAVGLGFAAALWLFGKQSVADWIARKVA